VLREVDYRSVAALRERTDQSRCQSSSDNYDRRTQTSNHRRFGESGCVEQLRSGMFGGAGFRCWQL
jgi:hypothetical protein